MACLVQHASIPHRIGLCPPKRRHLRRVSTTAGGQCNRVPARPMQNAERVGTMQSQVANLLADQSLLDE
eukprot:scaffold168023_cov39-Tisochrysis_lutea.AAC.1